MVRHGYRLFSGIPTGASWAIYAADLTSMGPAAVQFKSPSRRACTGRWPGWLVAQGRRSYSLYLVHAPLLGCLQLALPLVPYRPLLLFGLGLPLFVAFARAFHKVFERPFLGRPPWLERG